MKQSKVAGGNTRVQSVPSVVTTNIAGQLNIEDESAPLRRCWACHREIGWRTCADVGGEDRSVGDGRPVWRDHLQLAQERHQVGFLWPAELQLQDQVEEFHRVFQGQSASIMQVRGALLDAAQSE